ELLAVAVVELVAVAVAFADHVLTVEGARDRARLEPALLRAEAHRAALVGALVAAFDIARRGRPFGDQRDDRMRAMTVVLGRTRTVEAGDVAREIDDGRVHAVADAEIGNFILARERGRGDLALEAALAEAARHEDAVGLLEHVGAARFDVLGFEPAQVHARGLLEAAVAQRFAERLVGVLVFDVLADDRDRDFVLRMLDGIDRALPLDEV